MNFCRKLSIAASNDKTYGKKAEARVMVTVCPEERRQNVPKLITAPGMLKRLF